MPAFRTTASLLAFVWSPPSRTLRSSAALWAASPPARSSTVHRGIPRSRGIVHGPSGLISSSPTPWTTTPWSMLPT
eukprot:scaffold47_cov258-Pinguiococcus_pyrenoidosus.AAC.74